jgi:hypothetical protein
MPGDRHTVSARRAIYTENLVGDRVDMVDPGLVSHVPAPERHFALVGGAKPTQTGTDRAEGRLDGVWLKLAALIAGICVALASRRRPVLTWTGDRVMHSLLLPPEED